MSGRECAPTGPCSDRGSGPNSGAGAKTMCSLSWSFVGIFLRAKCLWFIRAILLFVLTLASCRFLSAQEATIVGTVTDQTGGAVPGVTIIVTNEQTGAIRTSVTTKAGQYVASGLPIGTYDLKAEGSAFTVEEREGVVINVNDRVR